MAAADEISINRAPVLTLWAAVVAERLGFRVTHGGKHPYVVRDPENPDDGDIRSGVTTIPSHLHRVINEKIFQQLCDSPVSKRMGITEGSVWKALRV